MNNVNVEKNLFPTSAQYYFFFLQIAITCVAIFTGKPVYVLAGLIFILLLPIFFSPFNLLIILIAYISILPSYGWGSRYEFFKLYVNIKLTFVLLLGIFFLLILRNLYEKKWYFHFSFLDRVVSVFLVYAFLNLMWGIYNNFNLILSIQDFLFIFFYAGYFLVRALLQTKRQIYIFLLAFIIIVTLTSIEYSILSFSEFNPTAIFLNRVTTQQPHLAQIAVPLLIAIAFFRKDFYWKLISLLLLIPHFLMVFFSQQRALWIAIVFSSILIIFFYYMRDKFSLKRFFIFGMSFLLFLGFIIFFIFILDKFLQLNLSLTIIKRLSTLFSVSSDASYYIRFTEVKLALQDWLDHKFLGLGLGAQHAQIFHGRDNISLDNTYAYLLWKMGLLGLFIFLLLYGSFLYRSLVLFWRVKSPEDKLILSGIISGMVGLLIIAYTNTSIIRYRFDLIWACFIGLAENIYLKFKFRENA